MNHGFPFILSWPLFYSNFIESVRDVVLGSIRKTRIVNIHCRTSLISGGSLTIDMDISQRVHSTLTLTKKLSW